MVGWVVWMAQAQDDSHCGAARARRVAVRALPQLAQTRQQRARRRRGQRARRHADPRGGGGSERRAAMRLAAPKGGPRGLAHRCALEAAAAAAALAPRPAGAPCSRRGEVITAHSAPAVELRGTGRVALPGGGGGGAGRRTARESLGEGTVSSRGISGPIHCFSCSRSHLTLDTARAAGASQF